MNERGIRLPEVLDWDPKLNCLPFKSDNFVMPESFCAIKTERNLVSS